ncbi:MAG: tyrosine phenol-lyase [Spirochaetes bacterium]|nr:MAG: tyrosine phenol-lyase [Spirochaetota bacterium]
MKYKWRNIIEPFKIKTVEPLGFTTYEEREKILKEAFYNLFNIRAEHVLIDLLTDSGTSAMSVAQWSAIMSADESYAGARSYYHFESTIKEITGYEEIIPVHQGRAAERILFSVIGGKGKYSVSNSHFDTTRANAEASGMVAVDFPVKEAMDFETEAPFKGNMDTYEFEKFIKERGAENISICIITATNNTLGGQPVSMKNLKEVSRLCKTYKIPLFIDCARFAENAYFIRLREEEYSKKPVKEIVKQMFSLADGAMMSAKKDAFANIGGFLAMKNDGWAQTARQNLILTEGFRTYGGLAGRDLDAIAVGLKEVMDERYLEYRIKSTEYLGRGLKNARIPIVNPPGGHGIYVNARKFLPHINENNFPAQSLVCELYLAGGIRAVEIGMLMFGKWDGKGNILPGEMELVRLAIPRRVYTQSHVDYVIEVFSEIEKNRGNIKGLEVIEAPPVLTHFTAKLKPLD